MASSLRLRLICCGVWLISAICRTQAELLAPQDYLQRPLLREPGDDPAPVASSSAPWRQLNFSSSAPHLFASAHSLLHQWSNTMFPNGHSIAAVEVPAYTLFYHGRNDEELPPSPEWLAFDLEMSYGIMGSTRNSWLLTYQTTRPVRALYFDGESAALMGLGQLDTQMLHVYGNVSGPEGDSGFPFRGLAPEYDRARGLCDWLLDAGLRGEGWGFEGVVRMNAGFEMIWCDFTSGSLRLLTQLNITAPLLPAEDGDGDGGGDGWERRSSNTGADVHGQVMQAEAAGQLETSYYSLPPRPTRTDRVVDPSHPPAPPNWRRTRDQEPFVQAQAWGWFDSATWHYGSTRAGPGAGEVRAKVLGCGLLSYYAPRFANQSLNRALDERPALNLTDQGIWKGEGAEGNRTVALNQLRRRRRYHHLAAVVPEEAAMMRVDSERALRALLRGEDCTGADWVGMTAEIVQRTTDHLTMLDSQLAAAPPDLRNRTAARDWLAEVRAQSHLFAVAFLEYPPSSADREDAWSTRSKLFGETYSRCRYRYTRLMAPDEGVSPLSPEERDLRWAVEETYGAVCSVLLTLSFEIEGAWARNIAAPTEDREAVLSLEGRVGAWREGIAELTAWLGWEGEYVGCKEVCAWDERCYIPMWPLIAFGGGGGPGGGGRGRGPPRNGTGPPGGGPPDGGPPGGGPPGGDGPPPNHEGRRGHGSPDDGARGNRTGPGGPGFKMPPRGPSWMGDETDLWEPRCVKQEFIMGR